MLIGKEIDVFDPFAPEPLASDGALEKTTVLDEIMFPETQCAWPVLDQIRQVAKASVFVQLWADFQELALLGGGPLDLVDLHRRLLRQAPGLDDFLSREVGAYRQAVRDDVMRLRMDPEIVMGASLENFDDSWLASKDDDLLAGLG